MTRHPTPLNPIPAPQPVTPGRLMALWVAEANEDR